MRGLALTALVMFLGATGEQKDPVRRSLLAFVSAEQFALAGVAPDARAEELSVREWGALARAVGDSRVA